MLTLNLFPETLLDPPKKVTKLTPDETLARKVAATLRKERNEILRALQQPFIFGFTTRESIQLEDVEDEGISVSAIGPEVDDELSEWSNEGIVKLHSVMLEQSIKTLSASGNPNEKLDVLKWIFEQDFVGYVTKPTRDGQRTVRVTNRDCMFTFAFCCRLEGHNPEVYRRYLREKLPDSVGQFFDLSSDNEYGTLSMEDKWLMC